MPLKRARFIMLVFLLVVAAFVLRLAVLQLVNADEFRLLASHRSHRTTYLPASRGRILDRNGVILAANRLSYDLTVTFAEATFSGFDSSWYRKKLSRLYIDRRDPFITESKEEKLNEEINGIRKNVKLLFERSGTVTDLSSYCIIEREYLLARLTNAFMRVAKGWNNYWQPMVIIGDIDRGVAKRLASLPNKFPGIDVNASLRRVYPWGDELFHVLGYLKEITYSENALLKENGIIPGYIELNDIDYRYFLKTGQMMDPMAGKSGIERMFEPQLRGKTGVRNSLRLGDGTHRIIKEIPPQNGRDIVLSIDSRFQRIAGRELEKKGHTGSVVIIDPVSGEVLALVSRPTIDPHRMMGNLTQKEADEIFSSPAHPLINRPISSKYPLGSVFKIVMSVAGLEEKAIDAESTRECRGTLKAGDRTFKCYDRIAHGNVNVSDALKVSCNIFFYKLSQRLTPEAMLKWASNFGLGVRTGIELPSEKGGNIYPSTRRSRRWLLGRKYQFAIGQGRMEVTPLQTARLISVIANGGVLVRPTILKVRTHPSTKGIDISGETLMTVREGLWRVVNESGGTAKKSKVDIGIEWSGKTGSAENTKNGRRMATHSWFACYVPAQKPMYTVVVMAERAGTGGRVAAPIAAAILESVFSLEDVRERIGKEE